ncbi:MAG: aminotransferase class I/II-fold pyridoxal phosphate-dependent enzyme [Nannocystaceae bacterium]|nr:aminotransferase class I/II-fold pyridoxal phosphate-dependent enzyme [Nannocystaceae bacterium]
MSEAPWQRNLRPQLAELVAYDVPPAQAFARMHANELPEPWPAHVMAALAELVRTVELGRYPDTSGRSLRAVLGQRHGCDPARIVLGNGSDEIISFVLTALGGAHTPTLVIPSPTFVMYRLSARVLGYDVREVPLDDAMELDGAAMHRALDGATVCFLARPNNPTGTLWSSTLIGELVAAHPEVVFVLDEAYIAYAPGASLWRADAPDNLVYMATLSKVGLAALRVGYAIATPVLAAALDKIRHPYNVSQTSLALAEAVLTRFGAEQQQMIATAIEQRARLCALLARIPDAHVFPSAANLVLARLGSAEQAAALCARLAAHGVLIKDMGAHPRLRGCVRASVGTAAELDRLESLLR